LINDQLVSGERALLLLVAFAAAALAVGLGSKILEHVFVSFPADAIDFAFG